MGKYDDFNLELSKVIDNDKKVELKKLTDSIFNCYVRPPIQISLKVCTKTTQGNGCDPSYTKISPCNRTYRL